MKVEIIRSILIHIKDRAKEDKRPVQIPVQLPTPEPNEPKDEEISVISRVIEIDLA